MSMSCHVVGFRPPDEEWKKHKAVWDACEAAGVDPPAATEDFFNSEPPDPAGVEIPDDVLEECGALKRYRRDGASGYEVDVSKLPKGLAVLRFYNSW